MPLKLHEIIEKANKKGFITESEETLTRPWQEESVLYKGAGYKYEQQEQSGNKLPTKWKQSYNKVETNPQQSGNKLETQERESDNKLPTNSQQSYNKVETISTTKWKQSDNNPEGKFSFTTIVGLQRAIIIFIYLECKISRSLTTKQLTIEHLVDVLKTSKKTIKTTIQRLEKKGCLHCIEFKNGRGGWSRYELSEFIYQEINKYESGCELNVNWKQSDNKVPTQPTTSHTLVSSSYINTTTDREELSNSSLPADWLGINYSSLEEFGFNQANLIQIHRAMISNPDISLTPGMLQDSINYFAFDLKTNREAMKLRHPPAAVITSILKQGNPYVTRTPDLYRTPREMALLRYQETTQALELQKIQAEEATQANELKIWLSKLTAEDFLNDYCTKEQRDMIGNDKIKSTLAIREARKTATEYFNSEIWPKRRNEISSVVPGNA